MSEELEEYLRAKDPGKAEQDKTSKAAICL